MLNHLARRFRRLIDRMADATDMARLTVFDWLHGPEPETEADRLRAERLRQLVKEGRELGLLDEGEDETTLAWHRAQRRLRRR